MNFRISGLILLCGVALGMGSGPAFTASEIIQAPFTETGPAGASYHDRGVCSLITGPRDDMPAGQFLLTVGDRHAIDATDLQLTGTYTTQGQAFTLHPDTTAAAEYFQSVLGAQLGDESAFFQLQSLNAQVSLAPSDGRLLCNVSLTGLLTLSNATQRPVSLSFKGNGIYSPGDTAPSAVGAALGSDPSCPTGSLAPLGLAPVPGQCTPETCLVDFKGYRWWTSYQYYGQEGNSVFPFGGFFYAGGLRTPFAPKNVFLRSDGLHLRISEIDLGGGPVTAGAEAVLMFKGGGMEEANLGYGRYLVTAKVLTTSSWATLDPNAAFGAFTYERFGNGSTGSPPNANRELDLAEISRWGWNQSPPPDCPNTGSSAPLCHGNAQFTLQPWAELHDSDPQWANLHRYTINPDVQTITLVMTWPGANQPVTFDEYDGEFTFEGGLPGQSNNTFKSIPEQNMFVPATNCERFHLNLWMGFFNNAKAKGCTDTKENPCPPNPPPSTLPQEVVVTNFEFRAQ